MDDLEKILEEFDKFERNARPEELKHDELYEKGMDEYLLTCDFEIEDYSFLDKTKIKYCQNLKDIFYLLGYQVSDINLVGQKEIYLLAQKNSVKLVIMGGLYSKSKIIWTEKILIVSYLIKQNRATEGIIITNRPADVSSVTLAHENNVIMVHAYDRDRIAKKLMDVILEYDIFEDNDNKQDEWYISVKPEYLSKFFSIIGYNVTLVKNKELDWDILINKKMKDTIVKTHFKPKKTSIIKEVILANEYYNESLAFKGTGFRGGIVITNRILSSSEIDLANKHNIQITYALSLNDMIWELLHIL